MKKSELQQIIREEISKVLKEGKFIPFAELETAIKYHEKDNPYYDETRLRGMFNQLKNSDQIKAQKKYSKYFGE